ncbi:MAG: adenylate/guanylate cyclase domain-containing protein, partial [Bacteroidota bacterium]
GSSLFGARKKIASSFARLSIRIRLSLGVSLAVGVGLFAIGTLAVQNQKEQLRLQTDLLGKTIVQNLVDIVRDNLLLKSIPVIHEIVFNVKNRKLPGMDALAVVDRTGMTVAHSSIDSIGHAAPQRIWQAILSTDSPGVYETETHFVYIEPIYLQRKDKRGQEKVFLGAGVMSFSKELVFAGIAETKQTVLLLSVLVGILAFPLVLLLAGKFLQIGLVLTEAARLMSFSKSQGRFMISQKDVVGTLTKELDLMIRQIHQKRVMEKFVSRATVQMVAEGKATASDGTRKVVAVLFSDVRNFTSLSENLWPEETVEILNQYLDVQTQMVHRHHGFVDKFMGDGLMSIFPGDHMAHDAVATAVAIQQAIAELNERRKKRRETAFSVGIGIAVGPVVLGSIGTRERSDYTAIGDTVNLASRLCNAAGSDEIFVSESVIVGLNGNAKFLFKPKIEMILKGKRNPVFAHHVEYSLA